MTLEQQMRTGLLVDAPVRHRSYRCRFVYVVVAHDGRAAERTYPGPEEPHHGCQTYRAHIVATWLQGRLCEQETQTHSSDMTEHIQSRAQYLSSRGLLRLLPGTSAWTRGGSVWLEALWTGGEKAALPVADVFVAQHLHHHRPQRRPTLIFPALVHCVQILAHSDHAGHEDHEEQRDSDSSGEAAPPTRHIVERISTSAVSIQELRAVLLHDLAVASTQQQIKSDDTGLDSVRHLSVANV